MPIVLPGGSISRRPGFDCPGFLPAPARQRLRGGGVFEAENRGREQRRVDRAGLADREGRDRHPGRHLHNRQKAVDAAQGAAFDRHAEHRHRGQRRGHARQVRRPAGPGDDRLEAAALRAACILIEPLGRAVGRDDAGFVADAEPVEGLGRVLHRLPIGLAAHDDADRAGRFGHVSPSGCARRRPGVGGPIIEADRGRTKSLRKNSRGRL
jgi:hypothetical protein